MMFHTGFALFGLFWLLAPVAVVILLVWAVTRWMRPPHTMPPGAPMGPPMPPPAGGGSRETPLDILQRRFASGEITAEEYQKARDLLRQ